MKKKFIFVLLQSVLILTFHMEDDLTLIGTFFRLKSWLDRNSEIRAMNRAVDEVSATPLSSIVVMLNFA